MIDTESDKPFAESSFKPYGLTALIPQCRALGFVAGVSMEKTFNSTIDALQLHSKIRPELLSKDEAIAL
jgi:hypothetical protein